MDHFPVMSPKYSTLSSGGFWDTPRCLTVDKPAHRALPIKAVTTEPSSTLVGRSVDGSRAHGPRLIDPVFGKGRCPAIHVLTLRETWAPPSVQDTPCLSR